MPYLVDGGQLQRVGIARALATLPVLGFLDEPTSALDLSMRGQIINLLSDVQEEYQLAHLFVSRDLSAVQYKGDHILVMCLGHIVEQCPKEELGARPLHSYSRGLPEAISLGPGQDEHRYTLRGNVLRRDVQGLGCRLDPRCHFTQSRCASERQELGEFSPGHWVRCRRAAELADAAVVVSDWGEAQWGCCKTG